MNRKSKLVDVLTTMEFPLVDILAGEDIIVQGTTDSKVFILYEGEVVVIKDGEEKLHFSDEGIIFGEISALLGEERTATIRTVADSRFYVIDDLIEFIKNHQHMRFTLTLLQGLAQQILDRDTQD